MSPEAPRPLDQRRDGGKIRHHHVEIQIKAGFQNLRADQHVTGPVCAIASKALHHPRLDPLAIRQGKAGVHQILPDPARTQRGHRSNRIIDSIADPDTSRPDCCGC
ncbi:MAG: hypothetical protein JJU19_03325 [Pararhodobacter sp.]|nr:hypothetical protein [Pararhodobacter sp.]